MKNVHKFTVDLVERVAWTFAEGFAGAWLVTTKLSVADLKVASIAGLAAVAKCILATKIGDPETAATILADW